MKKIAYMAMALVVVAGMASFAGPVLAATAGGKKKAAKAVVYTDFAKGGGGSAFGDDSKGCGGTFEARGGLGVFSLKACPDGWGCGATVNKLVVGPFGASSARTIKVRMKAPKDLRFSFSINETGCGPKDSPSFTGTDGADGEQWGSPELKGTGMAKEYVLKLSDFKASEGYGNPNGNKTVDLKGVDQIQVFVFGGQGSADLEIASIKFE